MLEIGFMANEKIMKLLKSEGCLPSPNYGYNVMKFRTKSIEDMKSKIIIGERCVNESKFINRGFDRMQKLRDQVNTMLA